MLEHFLSLLSALEFLSIAGGTDKLQKQKGVAVIAITSTPFGIYKAN
jgi:hypothetical protein